MGVMTETKINGISLVVAPDANAAAAIVADRFASLITANPQAVLGLATGGTPVHTYQQLVQKVQQGQLSFQSVQSFNLDEYVGLKGDHPQSYRSFMNENLFHQVDINLDRTHVPDGAAADLADQCQSYEAMIREAGGIDLQLLGIGLNGHIAFNEPGSAADSRTRLVDLTANTIQANARFFDTIDEVPKQAVTMGIGTIMESKGIVLLATGEGKAHAVERMIQGPVDVELPASILQQHPSLTVVTDPAAASQIQMA